MRGRAHQWYRPAIARENIRLGQQHRRRRIERGETAFQAAFLRALYRWAARHADDDATPIVVPSGATATAGELTRVVCALISIRERRSGRHA
jgi:hypothetical protein